jgi:uncharacterized protein YerC
VFGGLSAKQRLSLSLRSGTYERNNDLRFQYTPMTPDRADIIVKLRRENHSIKDIEDLTGINRGTISRVLRDPDLNPDATQAAKPKGYRFQKSWNDPKFKAVRELIDEGWDAKAINRETGIHYKVVRRIRFSMAEAKKQLENS